MILSLIKLKHRIGTRIIARLRVICNFPALMLLFTFGQTEILWLIGYLGPSLSGNSNQFPQSYLLLLPVSLLLLLIPFNKLPMGRTTRAISLFMGVCIITFCSVLLGLKTCDSFTLGLILALTVFSGAACSMLMYIDNLDFIRQRINKIADVNNDENRNIAIEQTMEELRAYFDNAARGIFSLLSIIVIVFSVIWALSPLDVVNNAQKLLWTSASVVTIVLLVMAAAIFVGKPASECMSKLSDLLIKN